MKNINKYIKLNNLQQQIRLNIMDMIIENKEPISLENAKEELSKSINADSLYIKETLELFIKENIMVINDGNIDFIYPVSAYPTIHKVTLNDGRVLNAMCAIDALGVAFTFNQDIEINSICSSTGNEINIELKDGKINKINNNDLRILHIDLEKYENWAASC